MTFGLGIYVYLFVLLLGYLVVIDEVLVLLDEAVFDEGFLNEAGEFCVQTGGLFVKKLGLPAKCSRLSCILCNFE